MIAIRERVISLSFLALLATASFAEPPKQTLSLKWDDSPPLRSGVLSGYAEVVKVAAPSVVAVLIELPEGASAESGWLGGRFGLLSSESLAQGRDFRTDSIGSGIILTADGYVLTNSHVVEMAGRIRVLVPGRETAEPARLIGVDPLTDIAVVKIDATGLPAAVLGKSADLQVGDLVLAIGNPFGLEHTVTSGIISALGRKNLVGNPFQNLIQTDAPINRGSSGGALIDNRGRVIGVTGAMVSDEGRSVGVGFAEPIESAVQVAEALITQGAVQRGYLGITFAPLSSELAAVFGVESKQGAVVADLVSGSPAERSELEPGDVVVQYGSVSITEPKQIEKLIAQGKPGTDIALEVVRYGEAINKTVTLALTPSRDLGVEEQSYGDEVLDGVVMADLDPGARVYFGVPPEISGVVVVQVDPGSAATEAGLEEGDVVLQVGRDRVSSVGQAVAAREKVVSRKVLLRVLGWQGIKFIIVEEAGAGQAAKD